LKGCVKKKLSETVVSAPIENFFISTILYLLAL